jgi:hypothetical protein
VEFPDVGDGVNVDNCFVAGSVSAPVGAGVVEGAEVGYEVAGRIVEGVRSDPDGAEVGIDEEIIVDSEVIGAGNWIDSASATDLK